MYFNKYQFNKMKVTYFIPFLVSFYIILLFSCNNEDSTNEQQTEDITQDSETRVQEKTWEEFFGTLPCADCSGIETTLRLSSDGSRFQLQSIYLGQKDNEYIQSGNVISQTGYNNNEDAIIYTLMSENERDDSKYFLRKSVTSDTLHMLDQDMKLIESELNYSLVKDQ